MKNFHDEFTSEPASIAIVGADITNLWGPRYVRINDDDRNPCGVGFVENGYDLLGTSWNNRQPGDSLKDLILQNVDLLVDIDLSSGCENTQVDIGVLTGSLLGPQLDLRPELTIERLRYEGDCIA